MELLEIKIIISKIKILVYRFNSRFDPAKENISNLENIMIECKVNDAQGEENRKWSEIYIVGVLEEGVTENYFKY